MNFLEQISKETQKFRIVEKKIRNATKHKGTDPTISQLNEISKLAEETEENSFVFKCLWLRINRKKKKHRSILRSLALLHHILIHSRDTLISQVAQFQKKITKLTKFKYKHHKRDKGINVREKAEKLLSLLTNSTLLRNEREKIQKKGNSIKLENNYHNERKRKPKRRQKTIQNNLNKKRKNSYQKSKSSFILDESDSILINENLKLISNKTHKKKKKTKRK